MKRQRGRGRKPGGGGGGNHGNRPLESNGPDVKIRGTAAQIYEKYAQYARDAQSGGDRVKYENYLQHAEHYFRIMAATMPRDRLFQQQGEGGMPVHQQGQGGSEGGQPPLEAVAGGEPADALKVMDDQSDDGDDYGNDDGNDDDGNGNEETESANQDDRQDNQQGDRQGRRRRRGRRRPHDGERSAPQAGADNEPQQPRSALDSLARRQGAIAGS